MDGRRTKKACTPRISSPSISLHAPLFVHPPVGDKYFYPFTNGLNKETVPWACQLLEPFNRRRGTGPPSAVLGPSSSSEAMKAFVKWRKSFIIGPISFFPGSVHPPVGDRYFYPFTNGLNKETVPWTNKSQERTKTPIRPKKSPLFRQNPKPIESSSPENIMNHRRLREYGKITGGGERN